MKNYILFIACVFGAGLFLYLFLDNMRDQSPPVPDINWDSVEFKKAHVIQDNSNDTTTERIPSHTK